MGLEGASQCPAAQNVYLVFDRGGGATEARGGHVGENLPLARSVCGLFDRVISHYASSKKT